MTNKQYASQKNEYSLEDTRRKDSHNRAIFLFFLLCFSFLSLQDFSFPLVFLFFVAAPT